MSRIPEDVKAYLRVPFVVIVWFMETYARNRAKVKALMASPSATSLLAVAILLTIGAWIMIGMNAKDEDKTRLTDTVKGLITDTRALSEEKKRQDALKNAETTQ